MNDDALKQTSTVPGSPPRASKDQAFHRGASLGRYIVLNWIGRGGMGVIYSAYDPDLHRKVALKIIRAEATNLLETEVAHRRLQREAQALARLNHPNVITVFDVGVVDNQVFIAMELVEGRDLRQWLEEEPRGWRQIVALFLQAGAGLQAAHQAGLSHRDFKPANVILGNDGRARVLDFGLAIPERQETDLEQEGSSQIPRLTIHGCVAGTPAYIAPERYENPEGNALSDQFSFCTALFESLYGELPFAGTSRDEVLANQRAGRITMPTGRAIPAWLRRVLVRGLAANPADRYPSMKAVLEDLEQRPRRRRMMVAVLTMATFGTLTIMLLQPFRNPCQGAERWLNDVWDSNRRTAIQGAFAASPKPYAEDLWRNTEMLLDGYTERWVRMRTNACEATHRRGEQSEQLLDLRVGCLDRRLQELKALTDQLSQSPELSVEDAWQAVNKLNPLDSCANVSALTTVASLPTDERALQKTKDLRSHLAETKARLDLGDLDLSTETMPAIEAKLEGVNYAPAVAEAHRLLGQIAHTSDDFPTAQDHFVTAASKADEGRHDEVRFRAAIELVWLLGNSQSEREAAQEWLEIAEGVLKRLERPPTSEVLWHHANAILRLREGDYLASEQAAFAAAELSRRHNGPQARMTARSLSTLGHARYRQGHYERAYSTFQEVTAIRRATLGIHHPEVAYSQQAEGELLKRLGRYEDALAVLSEALATLEDTHGSNHSRVAIVVDSLGNTYSRLGQYDEALISLRRGLKIWQRVMGEDSSKVAASLNNIGLTLKRDGRLEQALEAFQRALEIHSRVDGPEHPSTLIVQVNLGGLLLESNQIQEASALMGQVRDISFRVLGEEHTTSLHAGLIFGQILLSLGETEAGARSIAGALSVIERNGAEDWLLGLAHAAQAQAFWAVGDLQKTRNQLKQARSAFQGMGAAGMRRLQQLKDWKQVNGIQE